MNENQRAAYLISQSAAAMIEAMGMQAENTQREHRGESLAYVEDDFQRVILKYGIGTNSAISYLRD
jgi:hypothetical protein